MRYHRAQGLVLPSAFRQAFLVSEGRGYLQRQPGFEGLSQDNPVTGACTCNKTSLDQSLDRVCVCVPTSALTLEVPRVCLPSNKAYFFCGIFASI